VALQASAQTEYLPERNDTVGPCEVSFNADDPYDREGCEQRCRSIFGVSPYSADLQWGWGSGSRPGYYAYAACIQTCNNRFWKEFDRRMGEIQK